MDADGDGGGSATTTKFAYDENGNAWVDYTGSSTVAARHIFGAGVDDLHAWLDDSGNEKWYLRDLIGSVRDLVNSSGSLIDHLDYNSFGKKTYESASGADRYLWTSREYDAEIDLQYNRARYYDANTGRWISMDPLGFDAGDSNLYRYVNNGPTGATDPSGLDYIRQDGRGDVYWVEGPEPYRVNGYLKGGKENARQVKIGFVDGGYFQLTKEFGGHSYKQESLRAKIRYFSRQEVSLQSWMWNAPEDQRKAVIREYFDGFEPSVLLTWLKFMDWYAGEEADMKWVEPLRGKEFLPPLTIKTRNVQGGWLTRSYREYVLEEGWEWDNDGATSEYHPGAIKSIRKAHSSGVSAQACYSEGENGELRLITKGLGAGTADRSSSRGLLDFLRGPVDGHWYLDVRPFEWAKELDAYYGTEQYRTMYTKVRPIIVPARAEETNPNKKKLIDTSCSRPACLGTNPFCDYNVEIQ